MIIEWQRVGFVHGVMNTDNMSIHGIDRLWTVRLVRRLQCWLDANTTDRQHKDTALATNLKLLCGICTNWRMLCIH
jgi:hypothetical protein